MLLEEQCLLGAGRPMAGQVECLVTQTQGLSAWEGHAWHGEVVREGLQFPVDRLGVLILLLPRLAGCELGIPHGFASYGLFPN